MHFFKTYFRCEFGMCALDGFLYAFGGWVGEDIGGSIERYAIAATLGRVCQICLDTMYQNGENVTTATKCTTCQKI
jgi:hypothetical protein